MSDDDVPSSLWRHMSRLQAAYHLNLFILDEKLLRCISQHRHFKYGG